MDLPIKDYDKGLTNVNYRSFFEKWIDHLVKNIEALEDHFDSYNSYSESELKLRQVLDMIHHLTNWIEYLKNCFLYIPLNQIDLELILKEKIRILPVFYIPL